MVNMTLESTILSRNDENINATLKMIRVPLNLVAKVKMESVSSANVKKTEGPLVLKTMIKFTFLKQSNPHPTSPAWPTTPKPARARRLKRSLIFNSNKLSKIP